MRFPAEIETMLLEMEVSRRERERAAVLADPVKHKLTLAFPEGARMAYRFWPMKGKRGPEVRYCYSTERNLAGYFLGWRETIRANGEGKRDRWTASKRRKTVRDQARARMEAHKARLES